MKLKQAVEEVERSEVFKNFLIDNPHYYLAHIFFMSGKEEARQVGYYSKDRDRVVVFELSNSIKQMPEAEVFKEQQHIEPLDLTRVLIGFEEALSLAEELHTKKYPAEIISQKIVILQNLNGLVYNITHVTRTFNICNIKIAADTGEVLSEHMQSILGLQK